ncbi:hypothetical protein QFC20_005783 [Naganishia adeliensis]|uniref:Uncharacterized protein n=1 Tax=Naganishia adeliensis TaxID=92952 RepID=A0ACC2VK90_9TREE|nr:hypothetical protein QFC20_005783 [Naganishia adeliensis]
MEMLRVEREQWEAEAERERERREAMEDDSRAGERQRREDEARRRRAEEEWEREKTRADNLQEVLADFQNAKETEIQQATAELEHQLHQAVQSLAEWKTRAADAEVKMTNISSDVSKTSVLEREIKEKNAQIGRLRHEAVLTQEHLTEALRRLRRNTSDVNVDRRLVTNVLLQFIATPRADPKRFEMLSLLATILSWEDSERERAGLQRAGGSTTPGGRKASSARRKESEAQAGPGQGRTQEEQDKYNESFSDLFVEFLLKEAAQGQKKSPRTTTPQSPLAGGLVSPSLVPNPPFGRQRTYSTSSVTSNVSGSFPTQRPTFTSGASNHGGQTPYGGGGMNLNLNLGSGTRSPQYMSSLGQKMGYAQRSSPTGEEGRYVGTGQSPRSVSGVLWQSGQ